MLHGISKKFKFSPPESCRNIEISKGGGLKYRNFEKLLLADHDFLRKVVVIHFGVVVGVD